MVGTDEKGNFTDVGPGTPAAAWRRHPGWGTAPALTLAGLSRLVVVAAHPDDESLGAGGVIATASRSGLAVDIVCATDGEGSHPHSPTRAPEKLAVIRAEEGRRAAEALGVSGVQRLGLSDGRVADEQDQLAERVVEVVGDGERTVIIAPWRRDGHPDHEAVGRAAVTAARRTGAEVWEFPVWFWHWGDPGEAPWTLLRPFQLDDHAVRAKGNAIRAHASQIAPLSHLEGDETLLPAEFLAHFETGPEHYLRSASTDSPDDSD
jgi:LmbE family N-acetylglucosaminyl deacetylase